jgi:hypothetical protein
MALDNATELLDVLSGGGRLGKVFARHAYGMRAWVDRFSARIRDVADPAVKELLARLVADNARHMLLFRAQAAAHGVDPDAYACPPEGEAIYERIPELATVEELAGYALGSLDHFAQLLDLYASVAAAADRELIAGVAADVERTIAELRPLVGGEGPRLAAEAHARYRTRERIEAPRYAHAG